MKSNQTKLVCGMGFNNADYIVQPTINGKTMVCPFYTKWQNMLKRCYCKKFHEKKPTYISCSVIKEWLTFSNFRNWMIKQDWKDKELDKDILNIGNKVYAPNNCIFISHHINTLLNDCRATRGNLPQGIHFNKANGKYQAKLRYNGKQKYLGCFTNPKEASKVYKKAKYNHILEIANQQSDPRIKQGLINHANLLIIAT